LIKRSKICSRYLSGFMLIHALSRLYILLLLEYERVFIAFLRS